MSKTTEISNPRTGAIYDVGPGDSIEFQFDRTNNSPEVASYTCRIEGLPSNEWWRSLAGQYNVRAGGVGKLKVGVTPPPGALPGSEYTPIVVVGCDGEDLERIPLTIRVVDAGYSFAASPVSSVTGAEPAIQTAVVSSLPQSFQPVAPAAAAPPVQQSAPAVQSAPPIASTPAQPAPSYSEGSSMLVGGESDSDHASEDALRAPDQPAEPFLLDPQSGVIEVDPGATLLLRFPFTNDAGGRLTYQLDTDNSLDASWRNLVQDMVALQVRNQRGECSLRLSPPADALSGSYPFVVYLGIVGQPLQQRLFTLVVRATPAVRLKAESKTSVVIGPFQKVAQYALKAESAGNVQTAFRVAAKAPRAGDGVADNELIDVYQADGWRYQFDKEMEDLRSSGQGVRPAPANIGLKVIPVGRWWFGWVKRHAFRVGATPTSEPTNAGKSGNILELSLMRWRILPVSWVVAAPLAVLFLSLFQANISGLDVPDAYHDTDEERYFAANPVGDKKSFTIKWDASPLSAVRLDEVTEKRTVQGLHFGGGSVPETAATDLQSAPFHKYTYEVRPALFGAGRSMNVTCIFTKKETVLETPGFAMTEGDGGKNGVKEITVEVPANGKRVSVELKNACKSPDQRLVCTMVRALPDSSHFVATNKFLDQPIEPGKTTPRSDLEFKAGSNATVGDTDHVTIATTSAAAPILIINLQVVASGSKGR